MRIAKEFKEFAIKGNMFDMAIGVIIGTAFGKIVSSLVKDVIMPSLGFVIGRFDFSKLSIVLMEPKTDSTGAVIEPMVSVSYGNFIQVSIDFLIISACLFFVVKAMNSLRRKADDPAEKSVPTPTDIVLLKEIRDLLEQSVRDK